jgi:hypothetical protein
MHDEILTKRLAIVDSEGQERIILDASKSVFPCIQIIGQDRSAMTLCADGDRLRIEMARKSGSLALVIVSSPEGLMISTQDSDCKTVGRIAVESNAYKVITWLGRIEFEQR